MQYTTNYNLKKPESNDTANINDLNENMDILDEKLKEAIQNEQLQGDVTEIKGTTEEIKTSVGSSKDLSSSPTLFGRLAEIKETLTSKFSEVISKITGVDGKIGTSGDSGTDTVFGKLNKGFDVKVQSGTITLTTTRDSNSVSVPISPVNKEKSILLFSWTPNINTSHPLGEIDIGYFENTFLRGELNSSSIVFYVENTGNSISQHINWQVLEFA